MPIDRFDDIIKTTTYDGDFQATFILLPQDETFLPLHCSLREIGLFVSQSRRWRCAMGRRVRQKKRSELRITPISRVWCEQKASQHSCFVELLFRNLCAFIANYECREIYLCLLLFRFNMTGNGDIYSLFLKLHKVP